MVQPPRFRKTKEEVAASRRITNSARKYLAIRNRPTATIEDQNWADKKLAAVDARKRELDQALESRKSKMELEWAEAQFPSSLSLAELQVARSAYDSDNIRE